MASAAGGKDENGAVLVSNHPVLLHKLTKLRSLETGSHEFRQLMKQITFYIGYETTADLVTSPVQYKTPVGEGKGAAVTDRVALVPILRAGLGMVDAMLELVPDAKIHHIGMYRDKLSLVPIVYYERLPQKVDSSVAIVLEPMIATAGTINAALDMLKNWGVKRIKVMSIIAAKKGLENLHREHPDVEVHVGAVDDTLSDSGYIVPGLGDVGDRLWGTVKGSEPSGVPTSSSVATAVSADDSGRDKKRARPAQ